MRCCTPSYFYKKNSNKKCFIKFQDVLTMVKEQAPIFLLFLFLNYKLFKGCLPQFHIVHSWRHCSICISSKKYAISSDIQNESAENGTAIHQLTWLSLPVIRQKDESRSWGNKNTKHAQFKKKKQIFLTPWYPHVHMCIRSKKYSFFGKFYVLCFLVTSLLRHALLPYYRQVVVWESF